MKTCFFLILFLIMSASGWSESVSRLKIMHQKNPEDMRVLYYLATGCYLEKDYEKSYVYFRGLEELQRKKNLWSYPARLMQARALWNLGREYDAYRTCREFGSDPCISFLSWVKKQKREQEKILDMRYRYEKESVLELKTAESVMKEYPEAKDVLEFFGNYFFEKQQLEMAVDFWSLAGTLNQERSDWLTAQGRRYHKELLKKEGRQPDEEIAFIYYYFKKFAPRVSSDYQGFALLDVIAFFEQYCSTQGKDLFENFYRLSFLYHIAGKTELCEWAVSEAIKRAPTTLHRIFVEQILMKKYLDSSKTYVISPEDLQKIHGKRELYEKYFGLGIQEKSTSQGTSPGR
jgi:hypothetical protein